MKKLALALLFPATVLASECVLQDRTVTASAVRIEERSGLREDVVPAPDGGRRCMVNFKARVGATWYWAQGHYDWPGDRPRGEACAVAVSRAEDSVKTQVAPSHVRSEKVMVCSDQRDLELLRSTNPGSVGRLHQFRPHPDFPKRFWHNGAQCKFFLDSAFRNQDVYTYQGVICQVQKDQWVVVDKF